MLEERIAGTPKAQYVWSPVYVDALVERDRDANGQSGDGLEERLYAQQDANYNITALVDANGTVVERLAEDPYGKVTFYDSSWTALIGSAYGWQYTHQGLRFEAVAGLSDNRGRWYSPTLGRFVSVDPIGITGSGTNLYWAYRNGSVNRVDPSGTVPTDWHAKHAYYAGYNVYREGRYKQAYDVLISQISRIDGDREYLDLLRNVLEAYTTQLIRDGNYNEAQRYLGQLSALADRFPPLGDPAPKPAVGEARTTCPPAQPSVPPSLGRPDGSRDNPYSLGRMPRPGETWAVPPGTYIRLPGNHLVQTVPAPWARNPTGPISGLVPPVDTSPPRFVPDLDLSSPSVLPPGLLINPSRPARPIVPGTPGYGDPRPGAFPSLPGIQIPIYRYYPPCPPPPDCPPR